MKSFHRLAALLLVAILAVTLLLAIGCADNKLSTQEKRINIKVIVKKRDASYWEVVKMGAEAAEKEFGINVDFDGPNDEKDIEGQIRMVDEAIDEKVDALVLAACDYTKLVDVAEKAVSEKIPVIIIDSELKSDKMMSFIGTDNVDAGKKLGETLVQKIGDNCNIAVMSFVKGAASAVQREEGFSEAISKYPGIKVLSKEYSNSDENTAQQLTVKLVEKYPDMDAVVCLNAYGTVGAARAIDIRGLAGKVKIIGFDSTPEEVSFVEKDVIQSLVIQNPFSMGYLGIKYALDAMKDEAIPKRINTGSKVIDKANMYQPENQKLVFPFTK